eukprot:209315-Pyramimonas_sp.AAC.1
MDICNRLPESIRFGLAQMHVGGSGTTGRHIRIRSSAEEFACWTIGKSTHRSHEQGVRHLARHQARRPAHQLAI